MELKQAFDNIVAVCKDHQMKFDQHKVVERSIMTLFEALEDKLKDVVIEENKSGAV